MRLTRDRSGATGSACSGAPVGLGGSPYQPPNQTPMPWTTPIGKNAAAAISKCR